MAEYRVMIVPREMHYGDAGFVYESDVAPEEGAAIKVVEATEDPRTEDVIVMSVNHHTNTITVRVAGSES